MADKDILLGHSPDADDAFMFYGLTSGKVPTGQYRIRHILADIETLNERAIDGRFDLSALSVHAYAYVRSHYAMLSCGASMGFRYGPIVVASSPMGLDELANSTVAIPGTMTTAFLVLRMLIGEFNYQVVPFDKVLYQVAGGSAQAGLVIHEGQLDYERLNLHMVLDLGQWWTDQTGLPLPLGVNVVKRSLGRAMMRDLAALVRRSVEYGLENFSDAIDYAKDFAKDLGREEVEAFVRMYVNPWTTDLGREGQRAICQLLRRAEAARLIPPALPVDFI